MVIKNNINNAYIYAKTDLHTYTNLWYAKKLNQAKYYRDFILYFVPQFSCKIAYGITKML